MGCRSAHSSAVLLAHGDIVRSFSVAHGRRNGRANGRARCPGEAPGNRSARRDAASCWPAAAPLAYPLVGRWAFRVPDVSWRMHLATSLRRTTAPLMPTGGRPQCARSRLALTMLSRGSPDLGHRAQSASRSRLAPWKNFRGRADDSGSHHSPARLPCGRHHRPVGPRRITPG
jgi:hypothetical protein